MKNNTIIISLLSTFLFLSTSNINSESNNQSLANTMNVGIWFCTQGDEAVCAVRTEGDGFNCVDITGTKDCDGDYYKEF